MAAKQNQEAFYKDYLFEFSRGMNSGIAPLLIPKNQLSFAFNATVRGAYVTHRPVYRKVAMDFGGDASLQASVEQTLWQGGWYYKPDSGAESLIASIGGGLFLFTPGVGQTASVTDVGIPGDPNPGGVAQAWLWQAEKWIIVQDGQSKAIFYDGTVSRRSNSDQIVLGTTNAPFTVPAVGATVVISLAAAFLGQVGDIFFINGKSYQATTAVGVDNITLFTLYDTLSTFPAGSQVVIDPNVFGVQVVAYPLGGAPGTYAPNTLQLSVHLTQPCTFAVGTKMTILGKVFKLLAVGGNFALVTNTQTITITPTTTIAAGTIYFLSGTSYPKVVVGTLVNPFTSAAIGASANTILTPAYTGSANQVVFINGREFTITQIPPAPPGTNVTAININDTVGAVIANPKDLLSVPELPTGRMGAYVRGRNWMSLTDGLSFIASDIVGGSSGTVTNRFRDAVLKTTENTFLAGGGAFRVPGSSGIIRAMIGTATLDASLGQGALQVLTDYIVFSCMTPVERTAWQSVTNPILTESLISNGGLGQYSTIGANGDTLFRSIDGWRSLILARREFDTWGNVPISREMDRVIKLDAMAFLEFTSGIIFSNRALLTSKPTQSGLGVFNPGTIALNFDSLSNLTGKAPSVYDGLWLGLNVLQWIKGKFSGVERAFAFCYNTSLSKIELYELLADDSGIVDNNGSDQSITWGFESSVLFSKLKGKDPDDLCKLEAGEFYLADVVGRVDYQVFYRPQFHPCWILWTSGTVCANTNGQKQNKAPIGLGSPSANDCDPSNNRQFKVAESFQVKFVFTGSCRFYGARFWASPFPQPQFIPPKCEFECPVLDCTPDDDYAAYTLEDNFKAPPAQSFFNETVFFSHTCPDGSSLQFTGTLPAWITFDAGNNRLVGSAGTFPGSSQADANAKAQSAIDLFGQEALIEGTLSCLSPSSVCTDGIASILNNCYAIAGYFDGLITNTTGGVSGNPVWDGTFKFHNAVLPGWCAGAGGTLKMDGKSLCNCTIEFLGCIAGVPQWQIENDFSVGDNWTGTKAGGNTPEGIYTKISGASAGPATITIELIAGVSASTAPVGCTT